MCGHSASRSEPRLCFLSPDTCTCSPLPSSGFRGRSFRSPAVPHLHRYYGVIRLLLHPWTGAYGLPWRPRYRSCERRWRALLGSWGIPLEACPELGTPATPARPRNIGRPDAAFRLVNSVGIAMSPVFGAESSRPASLLCTLRTHQSPDEWQHSLSACVLALAVRDFHPLDSIKGFHRLIYGSSSSTLFPAR